MKITPLAFDSMGTRSMATYVETKDVGVLIDPSVSLATRRYNLPPHPVEFARMDKHWELIKSYAKKAAVLIVTHYHYDHHNPWEPEIYRDKILLMKHPTEKINQSQRKRASFFLKQLADLPKSLQFSDSEEFRFGDTLLRFSPPVFHGTNPRLGYVTEVLIDDGRGYRAIHTSDVEGPAIDDQLQFILENKPDLVILDGPLTYMLGFRYSAQHLNQSIKNMVKLIDGGVEDLVIDHHFMRDLKYLDRIKEVYEFADEKGCKVESAAEYVGQPIEMFEAKRRDLYRVQPVEELKGKVDFKKLIP